MIRQRFPKSFKREAIDQVLAATVLRHVAKTLGIAESPQDKALAGPYTDVRVRFLWPAAASIA